MGKRGSVERGEGRERVERRERGEGRKEGAGERGSVEREEGRAHQLDPVSLLVPLLWLLVGAFHLHGLERLWEVVALCEVLSPLSDVSLQQRRFLVVLKYPLNGCVYGGGLTCAWERGHVWRGWVVGGWIMSGRDR